jgi:hypothetical protein
VKTKCYWLLRRERIRVRVAEREAAESQARMIEIQQLDRNDTWEFDLITSQIRSRRMPLTFSALYPALRSPSSPMYCWQ